MQPNELVSELIEEIRTANGDEFKADEAAIAKSISQQDSGFSNITIRILSIIGSILACIFFVGFLAIADLLESGIVALVLGAGFIAGSLLLSRTSRNTFLDTSVVCFYIMGILLLGIGLYDEYDSGDLTTISIMIVGLLPIFTTDRFVLLFSGFIAVIGGAITLFYIHELSQAIQIPATACAIALVLVTVSEPSFIASRKRMNIIFKPLQAALFVSFITSLLLILYFPVFTKAPVRPFVLSAGIYFSVFFLLFNILKDTGIDQLKTKLIVYITTLAILAPLVYTPYLSGALLLLLVTFHYGYKTEFGISLLFLIFSISRYYYDLQITLLVKSGILCLTGVVFLLFWFFIQSQKPADEKI